MIISGFSYNHYHMLFYFEGHQSIMILLKIMFTTTHTCSDVPVAVISPTPRHDQPVTHDDVRYDDVTHDDVQENDYAEPDEFISRDHVVTNVYAQLNRSPHDNYVTVVDNII